jgi:hypothetical protein
MFSTVFIRNEMIRQIVFIVNENYLTLNQAFILNPICQDGHIRIQLFHIPYLPTASRLPPSSSRMAAVD